MAPDWADALAPVEAQLREALAFLAEKWPAGHDVLPSPSNVLRAFRQPLAEVRVLIVGQDPYPTPGHAVGLSFAVDGATRPIPRSLANIYKELQADLGFPPRVHGDLSRWADQGVLLLNRVLSVRAGAAGSHRDKGWEADHGGGDHAPWRTAAPPTARRRRWWRCCGARMPRPCGRCWASAPVIASAHPSPLSAVARFLRLPAVQPGQRAAAGAGNGTVDWELPPLP